MSEHNHDHDRLSALLAAAELQELTADEQAELERLAGEMDGIDAAELHGELLLMMDQYSEDTDGLPDELPTDLAKRVVGSGRAAVQSQSRLSDKPLSFSGPDSQSTNQSSMLGWFAGIAAMLAIGTGIFAYTAVHSKNEATQLYEQRLAALRVQIDQNQDIIQNSRMAAEQAEERILALDQELRSQATELAQNEQAKLRLAEQLAEATNELRNAELQIAQFDKPIDPEVLAERRQQLLEVPDSIQIAWQPFDLPDAPAEQRDVRGDVVWSDELQQGYIRFVGLDPNNPNIEQYQVWVIDERGLEQKVSGGVFNASADGEIIVPIEPGIDVGRVALFAVTVENPGGTWVPDLSRRVVVAPRDG